MKTWEFDVELRVRKTLRFGGPEDEETARQVVATIFAGDLDISQFLKWSDNRTAFRPVPIETIIDNNPTIVAAREVSE
jgi:hypothetical protein